MSSGSESKASLANHAQAYYSVGKYEKALVCLQRLASQFGEKDDPRVAGNLVLTEHAKGGFKRPVVIRDRITALRNSLKAGAGKTGDGGTAAAALSRAKDSLRLDAEDDDGDLDDPQHDDTDSDTSILLYNMAALHFHEKQYGASQQILHALFARIEVLEESLGVHVCFLLLDVLLHSARGNIHTEKDRERFSQNTAALLAYLERPHSFGPPISMPPDEDISASSASASNSGTSSTSGKNLEMTEFTFRLHLYKAKVRLLLGEVKSSKKELKSALEIFQRELRPTPEIGSSSSSKQTGGGGDSDDEDAATAASTTTNTLMGGCDASLPPAGVANVAALYLKANLEYLRQNYKKALKLLASCQKGEEGGGGGGGGGGVTIGSSFYLNDMGCLHSKTGLHAIALQYFQKALASFEAVGNSSTSLTPGGRPLENDGRVLPHALCEIVYNTGLQLLIMGRPLQAFRCFENASLLYYNRPRVWLRLAECCVQHHREEERKKLGPTRDRLVRKVLGQGLHRRVLLPASNDPREDIAAGQTQAHTHTHTHKEEEDQGRESLRGKCTLAYAVKCLKNVLFLLSVASQGGGRSRLPMTGLLGGSLVKEESAAAGGGGGGNAVASSNGTAGGSKEGGGATGASASGSGPSPATAGAGGGDGSSDTPHQQDDSLVEQVALLNLSYVYLCLHEPVLALHYAEILLSHGTAVSEPKQVTAHTYAAEALCALGRGEEALHHLLPSVAGLSETAAVAALQEQTQPESKATVLTADSFLPPEHFAARARSALHLNLANVHLMQGNLQAAEKCVRAGLAACPTSPDALRSLIFILLRTGNTVAALEVLKSRRPLNLGGGGVGGGGQPPPAAAAPSAQGQK